MYRDVNGQKTQLNPSLIAGSALLMRNALEQHGAKTYAWVDASPAPGSLYWLEDVDLNGTRIMHGPVNAQAAGKRSAYMRAATMRELVQPTSNLSTQQSGCRKP